MKKQDLEKKLRILNRQKLRCDLLISHSIKCPYCDALTNLLNIKNKHWKSKKCLIMKEKYLENKSDDKPNEYDILLKLNKKINEVSYGNYEDNNNNGSDRDCDNNDNNDN